MVCGLYPVGVRALLPCPARGQQAGGKGEAPPGAAGARGGGAQAPPARRKRLQFVFGGLLALAAVGGIVAVLALGVLGGDDGGGPGNPSRPERRRRRRQAARAEDRRPQGGRRRPRAAARQPRDRGLDARGQGVQGAPTTRRTRRPRATTTPTGTRTGSTTPGDTPKLGMLVHTLEHGRIDVQYKEGTSRRRRRQARGASSPRRDGYHMLLFENTTGMDAAVAATAWGHSLTCPEMNDTTSDALRTFRTTLHRQGPRGRPLGRRAGRVEPRGTSSTGSTISPRRRVLRRVDEQPPRGQALLQQRLADRREVAAPPRPGCRRSRRSRGPRGRPRPRRAITPSAIWSVEHSTAVIRGSRGQQRAQARRALLAGVERALLLEATLVPRDARRPRARRASRRAARR